MPIESRAQARVTCCECRAEIIPWTTHKLTFQQHTMLVPYDGRTFAYKVFFCKNCRSRPLEYLRIYQEALAKAKKRVDDVKKRHRFLRWVRDKALRRRKEKAEETVDMGQFSDDKGLLR